MGTVKHDLHRFVKANAAQIVVFPCICSLSRCWSWLFPLFLFTTNSSLKLVIKVSKLFKDANQRYWELKESVCLELFYDDRRVLVRSFVVYQNLTMMQEPISGHEARHVTRINKESGYLYFLYMAVGLKKRSVQIEHPIQFFDVLSEACPTLPRVV